MRYLAFILIIFFILNENFAAESTHLREVILSSLPTEFQTITLGKTTAKELSKLFGEPKLKENDFYYYNYSGVDYDLAFEIKNGIVSFISIDLSASNKKLPKHSLSSLSAVFSVKEKNIINDNLSDPTKVKHEGLRIISFKQGGVRLLISSNHNHDIKTVQFEMASK